MTRLFRRADAKTCAVEMADRTFAVLEDRIAELIGEGVFRQGEALDFAEAVWAALHGTTALLLDQADNLRTAGDALISTSIALIENGLLHPDYRSGKTKPC